MYQIQCKWSHLVVYSTLERSLALDWLEANNDPQVFIIVKVKE